ncbi:LysR substrate-binding domain-containing protein [Lachnotalea glycerini]|uniref:HTH lysR-type domain-containing protein n=1 Tax=Lachnotalea glycerini TaxID=1763509 RepID=A0A371JI16_9FIRM|nr:LysR substrate-binding domain-containing protein [Lachnotalea glycerini]RDY32381.1 hypothetical protein CG710_005220 [Lachnotalea glycerini]
MNLYHLRYFVTLAHLEHYTKAAAQGFGIAIVPDMPMLNQLPVKTLSIKNPSWERRFYMAYLKGQYQTPVVSDYIQFIKNKV